MGPTLRKSSFGQETYLTGGDSVQGLTLGIMKKATLFTLPGKHKHTLTHTNTHTPMCVLTCTRAHTHTQWRGS